jgi:hypothetical protein
MSNNTALAAQIGMEICAILEHRLPLKRIMEQILREMMQSEPPWWDGSQRCARIGALLDEVGCPKKGLPPKLERYTLAEIDEMRASLERKAAIDGVMLHERTLTVEQRLRTHMMNGTTPEELKNT